MMLEWAHVVIVGLAAACGGASGIVGAIVYLARLEPRMHLKLKELKAELSDKIDAGEKMVERKQDEHVKMFRDTFQGLREKIGMVELETERKFLPKDSFIEFLKEYRDDRREQREDMKTVLGKLDDMRGNP